MMSGHLADEIAYAFDRGGGGLDDRGTFPLIDQELVFYLRLLSEEHRRVFLDFVMDGNAPTPLAPGEPVPGCTCDDCTVPSPRVWRDRRGSDRAPALARLSDEQVEAARRVSILEICQMVGMDPVKSGRRHKAHCLFHDDSNPSVSIDIQKGLWFCFPCSRGGDGITLLMEARGLDFVEAVGELAMSA